MGNTIDKSKMPFVTRFMNGRRMIKNSATEITRNNVVSVLTEALNTHNLNESEIDYLYNYYRGKQPIIYRTKTVRPEICNKIVENRANEIVSFKVGYLCGEPIQYVSRNGGDDKVENINLLNEFMFSEDKACQDQEIVEWQMICGTAFRLVLPDSKIDIDKDEGEAPFEIYTLDPRNTFIVYSNEIGNKPLMAVKYKVDELTNIRTYSIYTKDTYFLIEDDRISGEQNHALGMIPIFEYPANNSRLGAFEIVLSLLDAINNVESNRLDGIEQIIQSFIKFVNCDITADDFKELKELGAIKVKSPDGQKADVDIVKSELDQNQTQTTKEDLYNSILTICGMPNRNGGSSTSDTGAAVVLRDGWSLAEARAKDSEHIFKKSEKKMLKLVLRICNEMSDLDLKLKDIDIRFTRRNYENIQSKSQVLISMLQEPKIHPQLAFLHSGLFTDAESAYAMSMKYYEEQMERELKTNADVRQDNKTEDDGENQLNAN
ncbi:MAG: phage portal protein [Peptostreptococcaceae bacterium]|nr:phage portal protein [Peptostreptococcaceae bacterium]